MHVSPVKHSYAWLPRKCDYRTDRQDTQTGRQTPDKVIPMCCYALQAIQKSFKEVHKWQALWEYCWSNNCPTYPNKLAFRHIQDMWLSMCCFDVILLWRHNCKTIWRAIWLWRHNVKVCQQVWCWTFGDQAISKGSCKNWLTRTIVELYL